MLRIDSLDSATSSASSTTATRTRQHCRRDTPVVTLDTAMDSDSEVSDSDTPAGCVIELPLPSTKQLAQALISAVPSTAWYTDVACKSMLAAFKLVEKALKLRDEGNARTLRVECDVYGMVSFGQRSLPYEIVTYIFKHYVPQKKLVHISRVSKQWMSVATDPTLWKSLDRTVLSSENRISMSSMLRVLDRPQFGMLKHLALPRGVKIGKTGAKALAKIAPGLQSLDAGYTSSSMHLREGELSGVLQQCASLTAVGFDTHGIDSYEMLAIITGNKGMLTEIHIDFSWCGANYVEGSALQAMTHCPSLSTLTLRRDSICDQYYVPWRDGISTPALIRIIDACPLEVLNLLCPGNNVDLDTVVQHVVHSRTQGQSSFWLLRTQFSRTPKPIRSTHFSTTKPSHLVKASECPFLAGSYVTEYHL